MKSKKPDQFSVTGRTNQGYPFHFHCYQGWELEMGVYVDQVANRAAPGVWELIDWGAWDFGPVDPFLTSLIGVGWTPVREQFFVYCRQCGKGFMTMDFYTCCPLGSGGVK